MTKTFIAFLLGQNQEGDEQAVDGDTFSQADVDQRDAEETGLLGNRTDGCRAGAAHGNTRADGTKASRDTSSQGSIGVHGPCCLDQPGSQSYIWYGEQKYTNTHSH